MFTGFSWRDNVEWEESMPDYLILVVGEQKVAVELSCVERVVAAAWPQSTPGAAEAVKGVVVVAGQAVPVIDVRLALGQPEREMACADQFVLCRAGGKRSALWVDGVEGPVSCDEEAFLPGAPRALKMGAAVALLYDIEQLMAGERIDGTRRIRS
jgi:chemotaxis signal transduction protein